MAVVAPYPDSPAAGTFMTTVELHPMASQQFEIGRPGIKSVELSRVVDRGIRESGFIDFEKLCIKEGEKVWQVFLDIFAYISKFSLVFLISAGWGLLLESYCLLFSYTIL